jgi:AcrR family transcriptional regulator
MNYAATTRQRILNAARELFAARGYRGASIRDITKSAGVNLGAVTYHFGTKQDLYQAVLSRAFDELAGRVEAAVGTEGSSPERLAATVGALFRFYREKPDVPRLALHQLAGGAGLPPVVGPYLRRSLAAIRELVEAGITAGDFRAVDPNLVAFTIISQAVWFAILGRSLVTVAGIPLDLDLLAERMEHHVTDVVTRFLAQEAGPS